MKNNNPKLKWWQKEIKFPKWWHKEIRWHKEVRLEWWLKGALWGLGFGFLAVIWWALSASLTSAPNLGFLIPLVPVFPIFWLLFYVIHLDLFPAIFIGWILGGIFYAWIFRWLTEDSQRNKKTII